MARISTAECAPCDRTPHAPLTLHPAIWTCAQRAAARSTFGGMRATSATRSGPEAAPVEQCYSPSASSPLSAPTSAAASARASSRASATGAVWLISGQRCIPGRGGAASGKPREPRRRAPSPLRARSARPKWCAARAAKPQQRLLVDRDHDLVVEVDRDKLFHPRARCRRDPPPECRGLRVDKQADEQQLGCDVSAGLHQEVNVLNRALQAALALVDAAHELRDRTSRNVLAQPALLHRAPRDP
eukprot:CAMPEP_0179954460 /NCGR_PEP_ID=MMETSP0983-20121128/25504_1 /TAXON_ID=483367 /ORGANISM="non described non described, Strain CCMP 2436" /LENGTH=243 /DNA_ID=CAMNT_0021865515 /DNA_START=9 /DNA_END=742 /DNA_ORIENTATION=-